ncbi:MAG: 4'-phosphopantetheinyl transferase superfamily protein [Candidatus Nanopelagicales bacterium]
MRWLARGESALPGDWTWLTAAESARAARLRFTKRRMEFLVSRWAAKEAIAALSGWGPALDERARIDVRNRPTGAPEAHVDGVWLGREISLTDRAGWAVCLIGPDQRRVGCDLELVEPRTSSFISDYFTGTEQERMASVPGAARDTMANLLWSAKESALKVLGTGLRRDTRSVEVSLRDDRPNPPPDDPPEDVTLVGWRRLTVRTSDGLSLPGWWCRFNHFLLTVAAEAATAAPAALEDPPALYTAMPTHTWMAGPL